MGLFDKLMGKDVKLTPKSAFLLSVLSVIAVDGHVDEEELLFLRRLAKGDADALDRAVKVFRNTPPKECVPLVAAVLDDKQKRTVMANLVDLAMADGFLAGAEKDLLALYLEQFKMSEAEIKDVVEVVALKNNYSVF